MANRDQNELLRTHRLVISDLISHPWLLLKSQQHTTLPYPKCTGSLSLWSFSLHLGCSLWKHTAKGSKIAFLIEAAVYRASFSRPECKPTSVDSYFSRIANLRTSFVADDLVTNGLLYATILVNPVHQ